MKKLLLFIVVVNLFQQAKAYPISPRPLRKLVIESDCIIQAYVLQIGEEKIKTNIKRRAFEERTSHYALLLIREVWQGEINTDTLKIYYPAGMICPAPPRFEEATEIIAFLDKKEEHFTIHALSYGVKTFFQKAGIAIYKTRILQMQKILLEKDSYNKQNAVLEWLVACAENEHTRWEGVYELSPHSDFMSYYDREGEAAKGIYISALQRQRLFTALITSESQAWGDMGLIDLCQGVDDEKLLEFLKNRLAKMDTENLWPAGDYMERIINYTNDTELKTLYGEFEKCDTYKKEDTEKKKKIFADFVEKMKDKKPGKILSASGNTSV